MRDIYQRGKELTIFLGDGISHRTPLGFHKTHTPSADGHDFSSSSSSAGEAVDCMRVAEFWDAWRSGRWSRNTGANASSGRRQARPAASALSVFSLLWTLAHDQDRNWPPAELAEPKKADDLRALFEALRMMLLSPWWRRVWVVQEVAVAGEPVTVRLGDASAPWNMLARAARHPSLIARRLTAAARAHHQPPPAAKEQQQHRSRALPPECAKVLDLFASVVSDIDGLRHRWRQGGSATLLSLLYEFGHRDAADERDRVYALLGLATAEYQDAIPAEYSASVKDVYVRTADALLARTGKLALFSGNQTRKNRRDLPSWVPDWSAVIEPGDRARAAVLDLYDEGGSWRSRIVTCEEEYWRDVRDGMRALLEQSQVVSDGRSSGLPSILAEPLRKYRIVLERYYKLSRLRPLLLDIIVATAALQKRCTEIGVASPSLVPFFAHTKVLRGDSMWLSRLLPCAYGNFERNGTHEAPSELLDELRVQLGNNLYEQHREAAEPTAKFAGPRDDALDIESLRLDTVRAVGERMTTWGGSGGNDGRDEDIALQVIREWIYMVFGDPPGGVRPGDRASPVAFARTLVGNLCAVGFEDDRQSPEFVKLSTPAAPHDNDVELTHWFMTNLLPAVERSGRGVAGGHRSVKDFFFFDDDDDETAYRDHGGPTPPEALGHGRPLRPTNDARRFRAAMTLATEGRSLFVTRLGAIGLGPASMRPGDEVHLLPSSHTHMVLRPAPDAPGYLSSPLSPGEPQPEHHFRPLRLIGDCYLDALDAPDSLHKSFWLQRGGVGEGSLPQEILPLFLGPYWRPDLAFLAYYWIRLI